MPENTKTQKIHKQIRLADITNNTGKAPAIWQLLSIIVKSTAPVPLVGMTASYALALGSIRISHNKRFH